MSKGWPGISETKARPVLTQRLALHYLVTPRGMVVIIIASLLNLQEVVIFQLHVALVWEGPCLTEVGALYSMKGIHQILVHTAVYHICPRIKCFHHRVMALPVLNEELMRVGMLSALIFHLTTVTVGGNGIGVIVILSRRDSLHYKLDF